MYMDAPDRNQIDFEKYENALRDRLNAILEKITNVFNISQEFKNNNQQIERNIYQIEIIELSNKIALFIKENHIIEREYYDFKEIQLIIKETLRKNHIKEYEILLDILREFYKINVYKFNLINKHYNKKSHDDIVEEFEWEYNKFNSHLFQCRVKFYSLDDEKGEKELNGFFEYLKEELE